MGLAEIVDLIGVSRQRVDQLTRQKDFPEPVTTLQSGRIWNAKDIEVWARETGRIGE